MEKKEIIEKFKLSENDTGSVQVQVALLTERINHLNEHLKLIIHAVDFFKWLEKERVSYSI